MKSVLVLYYPTCGTCKKAIQWLKEKNIPFTPRHIVESKPSAEELTQWVSMSKLPVKQFFNTSGKVYKERNLKETVKVASEKELIELLSQEGMLVKRPLLISPEGAVLVGFKEAEWKQALLK